MTVNRRKAPTALAIAMSLAGCDYIGPQFHTKMRLPEPVPVADVKPVEGVVDDSRLKSAKSEFFPSEDTSSIATKTAPTAGDKASGKGEYSLNFDDADLGEVAKVILSDILGKNYTLSPQVTGKVTLQTTKPLTKEELMPTLEMLLSVNNAAIVAQGDMYLIKPSNEAVYNSSVRVYGNSKLPNGYQTRIIPIRNVSASEIADILKPLMPEKSQMQVEPNRNLLVVSGSGSDLTRILDIINIFDVDVLKGRSFALFTMAHVDASNVVKELEEIFVRREGSGKGGGGFFRFLEIDRLNAILAITQNEKYLHDVESWVLRLDKINTEAGGGVNVYRAQNVNAIDLANTLNGIFGNGSTGGSRSASIASGRKSMSSSNKMGSSSSGGMGGGSSMSSGGLGGSGSSMGSSSIGGSSSGIGGSSGMSSGLGGSSSSSGIGGSSGSGLSSGTGSSQQSTSVMGSGLSGGSMSSASGGAMGMGGNSMGMSNVRIIADEGNNALIIIASSEEYARIQKVIKQLDVLPMQVIIDATIVEVTLNNDLQYGIQWYLKHNNGGTNVAQGGATNGLTLPDTTAGGSGVNLTDVAKAVGAGGFGYAFASGSGDINAVLKAGAANNNINVISSPSLMVLNNQEATIKVGDSVPIRSSVASNLSGNSNNGIVQTSSIQMIDTGVILSVKPRVNAGGLVMLDVSQSVNHASETKTSTNIDSPTIQKREIQTAVVVQSGETLVLGGLIKEDNNYSRSGVPFLHELPLIGPLFGSTTRNKDKSELVVLITPRVINSRQDAATVTDEFRRKLSSIYDVTPIQTTE
jgi:general secretion pathway protein D